MRRHANSCSIRRVGRAQTVSASRCEARIEWNSDEETCGAHNDVSYGSTRIVPVGGMCGACPHTSTHCQRVGEHSHWHGAIWHSRHHWHGAIWQVDVGCSRYCQQRDEREFQIGAVAVVVVFFDSLRRGPTSFVAASAAAWGCLGHNFLNRRVVVSATQTDEDTILLQPAKDGLQGQGCQQQQGGESVEHGLLMVSARIGVTASGFVVIRRGCCEEVSGGVLEAVLSGQRRSDGRVSYRGLAMSITTFWTLGRVC